ncbi:DUF6868 family protein [Meridianimarinicoccus aquatilis]|uniref:DUF6868 domain-containing protein n=1 Tax=Meridianimarinicoccus aquatilis TaxID=2552766 RepID=A0A4R6APL4_9RHOB|nr:hypothetical protein [Fluviibacterium aquatile]TDL86371.1 hypothetical protein E2L05_13535 [Fluviibacterium aquatile]
MYIQDLTAVFGWMTVINGLIYAVAVLVIVFGREPMVRLHSGLLGLPHDELPRIYTDYLARYKIAILILNFAPWLALRIVG